MPQARTQQEFDDWLDLLGSADPQSTAQRATQFVARYPRSEFAARVYQAQMLAYQEMDDYQGTVAAGKMALRLDPDNLHVLATLANVIPNSGGARRPDHSQLDEAANYARRALSRLTVQKIPRSLAMEEWQGIKLQIELSARAALGLISLVRGQTLEAIRELEWVTERDTAGDGLQFLRLGSAYAAARNYCAAGRAFNRAALLGPEPVRVRAVEAKKHLGPKASGC